MAAMNVYRAREASPVDGCSGVFVILAARSRMEAVDSLRRAGFAARQLERVDGVSGFEQPALANPGVIFWSDIWEEPRRWHRM